MAHNTDQFIQRYCECARATWNNHLWTPDADEASVARFDEIRALLFRALVLDALGQGDAARDEENEPWPFLRVETTAGPSTVLVHRAGEDGNDYWEPAEKGTDLSDSDMLFVDLFDWDPQAFRDLALVMVQVVASPKNPELVGRTLLLERNGVTVIYEEPDRL